jgi:aspartate/methionine/tyrosine aminotransferase
LQESRIREVANAGMGRSDVLPFWFGESDEVTPEFIREAAIESLQRGETFYAHNLGLPELRDADCTATWNRRCTGRLAASAWPSPPAASTR